MLVWRDSWRHLQRLEELDNGPLIVGAQVLKVCSGIQRFSGMGENRLPNRGELAMMEEGRFIGESPKFACDEFAVPGKEGVRTRRSLHVERLDVWIVRPGADVVQLQVGERGDPYYAICIGLQPGTGQRIASQIYFENRRFA